MALWWLKKRLRRPAAWLPRPDSVWVSAGRIHQCVCEPHHCLLDVSILVDVFLNLLQAVVHANVIASDILHPGAHGGHQEFLVEHNTNIFNALAVRCYLPQTILLLFCRHHARLDGQTLGASNWNTH